MKQKTVFITGCSTGFGKLSAKLFHKNGWNVIATMRSPQKETELTELENVLLIKLDVTNKQSIKEAVAAGVEKFEKIDVLVNNAGVSGMGVFEQWDDQKIQNMFNTNVFGMMNMTKEVLPYMRKQEEGLVINISSMAGLFGSPFSAVYTSSKFAVEGFTEAIALEYAPFNIKAKVIAPGAYETNLFTSIDYSTLNNGDEQIRDYSKKLSQKMNDSMAQMRQEGNQESDPQEVADKIFQCATEETPVHNVSGKDAEAMLHMKNSISEEALLKTISDMFVPEI